MTTFTTDISRTGRPFGLVARMTAAFAQWTEGRATRKALAALSDHELDDIGLCRGDIDEVVSGRR